MASLRLAMATEWRQIALWNRPVNSAPKRCREGRREEGVACC